MKYRDAYRIVTQVSRYVSHRDFRYRATPTDDTRKWCSIFAVLDTCVETTDCIPKKKQLKLLHFKE